MPVTATHGDLAAGDMSVGLGPSSWTCEGILRATGRGGKSNFATLNVQIRGEDLRTLQRCNWSIAHGWKYAKNQGWGIPRFLLKGAIHCGVMVFWGKRAHSGAAPPQLLPFWKVWILAVSILGLNRSILTVEDSELSLEISLAPSPVRWRRRTGRFHRPRG
jgi:hypothetical protein